MSDHSSLEKQQSISDAARACLVYATVPYVGIIFVPIGLFFSIRGFWYSADRRTHVYTIAAGVAVLGVQLLLWWLLYYVPIFAGAA